MKLHQEIENNTIPRILGPEYTSLLPLPNVDGYDNELENTGIRQEFKVSKVLQRLLNFIIPIFITLYCNQINK
jgi:hypothetical protein